MQLVTIPLHEILPPPQPVRAAMDEGALRDLAESISRVGLIVPLHVQRCPAGYEVIAGHRRLVACQQIHYTPVKCYLREDGDPSDIAIKVHENFGREELSPVEEAGFFTELYYSRGEDVDKVCELVHHPRSYVERRLLLMSGDPVILQALADKRIGLGVAEELNKIAWADQRKYYLDWAVRVGASVSSVRDWRRQCEAMMAAQQGGTPSEPAPPLPAQTEPTKQVCFICGKADHPEQLEFWFIHTFCRLTTERQAEQMDRAQP